jgi:hypothetical protein
MAMQEFMSIVESFNSCSPNSRERGGDRHRETWTTTRSLSPRRETHTHTPDLPRANSPTNFDMHHNPFRAHQHSTPCTGDVNHVNQVNQDPRVSTHRHFALQRDLATRVAANFASFRTGSGHFVCASGGACMFVCICELRVYRVCITSVYHAPARAQREKEREGGRERDARTLARLLARTHTHTHTHTHSARSTAVLGTVNARVRR